MTLVNRKLTPEALILQVHLELSLILEIRKMVNCFHLDPEKKATFKRTFYNETFGRSDIHNSHISNSSVRNHNCVLFLCASVWKIKFLLFYAHVQTMSWRFWGIAVPSSAGVFSHAFSFQQHDSSHLRYRNGEKSAGISVLHFSILSIMTIGRMPYKTFNLFTHYKVPDHNIIQYEQIPNNSFPDPIQPFFFSKKVVW